MHTQDKMTWLVIFTAFTTVTLGMANPTAEEILRGARASQVSQSAEIEAQLRHRSETVPFVITAGGGEVRYTFTEPEQEIVLRLGEDSAELSERVGGRTAAVKAAQFDERVRGTPVTYEDLALQFLYWPRAKVNGKERIKATGQDAWIIELQAPRESQYGAVRLWIDVESGALTQIHGFNRDGKKIKQFTVVSIQRLAGEWMLKSMRIETVNPETGKAIGSERTYLEILGKKDEENAEN